MQLLPGSGRQRVIALGAVVVLAGLGVLLVTSLADDPDDDAVRSAADRTSDVAPTGPTDPADEPDDDGTTSTTSGAADGPRPTGTDPRIALEPVADLEQPSAVVDPAGDGPVLVSTLDGRIHSVDLASGESEVVLDLTDLVSTGGERGLLGMALDPAGERLYVDFTDAAGDTDIRSWAMSGDRPAGVADDGVLHLELGQPFANHNGGNLVFGPDGALWIGTGDGGSGGDPGEVAQDPGSLLGKMLRVVPGPSGGVRAPDDNPDWGGRSEIWGIGLRNPWRYSFDRATGRLWIADVGQSAVEEVTVVEPDAPMPNFGWDDVEGDQPFEGSPDPSFLAPAITYGHDEGCSITGGVVVRGGMLAALDGHFLYSDFCSGFLRSVDVEGDGRGQVRDWTDQVGALGQVTSFGLDADGAPLVLTADGTIRRLTVA